MSNVLVLGCGPAGLLAAHAVEQRGGNPVIYSNKMKSKIGGAQYLHERIPGFDLQPTRMMNIRVGDQFEYARKVYNDGHAPVSWSRYPDGESSIYNMRDLYDQLWERYKHKITDISINGMWVKHQGDYEHVVSTLPLRHLCIEGEHEFTSQRVFIDYRETGAPGCWVLYNGRTEDAWYRGSRLFGWESWEYSHSTALANAEVVKPIGTDCDCLDSRVLCVGRYGKWDKSQLIHNAYFDTLEMMEAL